MTVAILLSSLDLPVKYDKKSLGSFLFMPHTIYVTENGLDDFGTSMYAHYQLTQRLTYEFAIWPFIQH